MQKRGMKNCKNHRVREFVVGLCVLVISQAILIFSLKLLGVVKQTGDNNDRLVRVEEVKTTRPQP